MLQQERACPKVGGLKREYRGWVASCNCVWGRDAPSQQAALEPVACAAPEGGSTRGRCHP